MNTSVLPLVDAFAGLRTLVVGEAMLDVYLEGRTGGICREAPTAVVNLTGRRDLPGGAANAAANVRGLGSEVIFLSVVGADTEGDVLRQILEERGVTTTHVLRARQRCTLVKNRVVADGQIVVRFDQGSTEGVERDTEQALIDALTEHFPRCQAVLVSDYGYGVLTPRVIDTLAALQAQQPRVVVVDSKRRLAAWKDAGATAVKPNFEEALELLGRKDLLSCGARAQALEPHGPRLLQMTGAQIAAVTIDEAGTLFFERERPPHHVYAQPARKSCVAGAGDTFAAALTLALAAEASTAEAGELASAAAAVVVARERTACCSAQDLRQALCGGAKHFGDARQLAERLEYYKQQGQRVVFTNGCFDILHRGHINYLHQARALGDVLVVGVNADDSIRRLKGPTRPINNLDDRIQVLAALSCVDHLVAFSEDTPCELIRVLKPNVFVKGGDYTRERLPEAPLVEELGGVVRILPYLADRSTTKVIERIQETSRTPAASVVATMPVEAL